MINKIIENIEQSLAEKIITVHEFRSIVSKKWEEVLLHSKNIKRLTENNQIELLDIFEDDLFISFGPDGGHQPIYLCDYIRSYRHDNLVDTIVSKYTKWGGSGLQRWHNELKESEIFNIIDKQWSKKESEYLELISTNYSDYINSATYFFSNLFQYDNRYEILYKYYYNINIKNERYLGLNENVYEQIIDNATKSDIDIKFLHKYIEIKKIELNIPSGLAIKNCKYSGVKYIEHFHITKYACNHLYLPYCETISGWTYNHSPANKKQIEYYINENDALELLVDFCNTIDGIPCVMDWNFPTYTPDNVKALHDIWVKSPTSDYYKNLYGDFRAALIKASLVPQSALKSKYGIMCVAKDGHFCRSMAEQKIDNWLYNNNIIHEIEPVYPKDNEYNKSGRMRADWKIGNIYVEYFGLPEEKKYAEKMEKKRHLSKVLGVELIELFQDDLFDLDKSLKKKLENKVLL